MNVGWLWKLRISNRSDGSNVIAGGTAEMMMMGLTARAHSFACIIIKTIMRPLQTCAARGNSTKDIRIHIHILPDNVWHAYGQWSGKTTEQFTIDVLYSLLLHSKSKKWTVVLFSTLRSRITQTLHQEPEMQADAMARQCRTLLWAEYAEYETILVKSCRNERISTYVCTWVMYRLSFNWSRWIQSLVTWAPSGTCMLLCTLFVQVVILSQAIIFNLYTYNSVIKTTSHPLNMVFTLKHRTSSVKSLSWGTTEGDEIFSRTSGARFVIIVLYTISKIESISKLRWRRHFTTAIASV